ncbi:MAG TPA: phage tail protein [Pedomonas sp.]|uniref:phage tail protein n=1 Tax=Pedomonas sp. TaxID=2976421 RepID=UPI002F42B9E2
MIKPDSLRQHLLEAVPGLALNPEILRLSITQGRTAIAQSETLSFEYRYDLTISVSDFEGNLDVIMVTVLAWLARHQPERLRLPAHEALTFEMQTTNTNRINATIVLALTEKVLVEAGENGSYTLTYVPEPDYDSAFDGVPDSARLWTLVLGGATVFDIAPES